MNKTIYDFEVLKYDNLLTRSDLPHQYKGLRNYDGYILPNELISLDLYLSQYKDLLVFMGRLSLFDLLIRCNIDWDILCFNGHIPVQFIGIKAQNSIDDLILLDELLCFYKVHKSSIARSTDYESWYENVWLTEHISNIGIEYFLGYTWEQITEPLGLQKLKKSEDDILGFLTDLFWDELFGEDCFLPLLSLLHPNTVFEKYKLLIFSYVEDDFEFVERYYASVNSRQLQMF